MPSEYSGKWSPAVRKAIPRRYTGLTEEEAEEQAARREFAEEDALADDMDRRDFEADGRL